MILRDKVDIAAPPEAVWTFLSNQEELRKWNPKIKAIVPISSGNWAANSMFRMRYALGGNESNFLCEILEYDEPARIVIHLKGGNLPLDGYMQEIYELSASRKGTLLKQSIVAHKYGTKFLSRALIFLSHYLYRPRRKRYLLKLKELAEDPG